jgi:hypothetical protein
MVTACPRLYIALIHFPVYNKTRQVVATSLTTLNLHDLARLTVTYGTQGCYVVTPLQRQQELAQHVIAHWTQGYGTTLWGCTSLHCHGCTPVSWQDFLPSVT